ncbi:MAG TPA: hypothetical protein VGH30_01315 [Jatrophihabitantaceae bacterium]
MRFRCTPAVVTATLLAVAVAPIVTSPANAASPTDDYITVAPTRVFDTVGNAPLKPGQKRAVQLTGGTVPTDAVAADITVTASGRSHSGKLSIEPCGTSAAKVTVLRFAKAQSISDHVNAPLGTDGKVCVRVTSKADFQIDLDGYYPSASGYHPITPTTVLATRTIAVGAQVSFKVAKGPIPTDTTSVAFYATASFASNSGRIVLWPCGEPRPAVTAVSYPKTTPRIGFALSPVGSNGKVCAWASHTTSLAVVAVGYYAPDTSLHAIAGAKVAGANVTAGAVTHVKVTGRSSHVAVDARGVQLSIETSGQHAAGKLTLYACGHSKPATTVETYGADDEIDDIAVTSIGAGGQVCIVSSKPATLVVRLMGWYDNA